MKFPEVLCIVGLNEYPQKSAKTNGSLIIIKSHVKQN